MVTSSVIGTEEQQSGGKTYVFACVCLCACMRVCVCACASEGGPSVMARI